MAKVGQVIDQNPCIAWCTANGIECCVIARGESDGRGAFVVAGARGAAIRRRGDGCSRHPWSPLSNPGAVAHGDKLGPRSASTINLPLCMPLLAGSTQSASTLMLPASGL